MKTLPVLPACHQFLDVLDLLLVLSSFWTNSWIANVSIYHDDNVTSL